MVRPLPGFEALVRGAERGAPHRGTEPNHPSLPDDPLLVLYWPRLRAQGVAPKGFAAYRYQLRSLQRTAARLVGREVTSLELFQDADLMGRTLVDATAPTLGTHLSKWTLAQRRSAIRSFAVLMRPELLASTGEEPEVLLDRALRAVAERVGTGYRLTGGAPRRRGGPVPTEQEVVDILEALGHAQGYIGLRDHAFFAILAESGARVNALRLLDGTDCVAVPSGRLRIFLHEKGKAEPREVELGHRTAGLLRSYAEAFNYLAAARRWRLRVRLGEPGAVWRNSGRGCWSYVDVRHRLRVACVAAGVEEFTPHALRRAFATDAASLLPRSVVAQAGGWQGLERLDDHYVQPHAAMIWDKLERCRQPAGTGNAARSDPLAAAPAL